MRFIQMKVLFRSDNWLSSSFLSDEETRECKSIIAFIKLIPVEESHYGRDDSSRQYIINTALTLPQLWRLWKAEREADLLAIALLSKFGSIFRNCFNLSFCKPKVDICSFCEETQNQLKAGIDVEENTTMLELHHLRAKRSYKVLKESAADQSTLCISFDMQQNRPLPKTNVMLVNCGFIM